VDSSDTELSTASRNAPIVRPSGFLALGKTASLAFHASLLMPERAAAIRANAHDLTPGLIAGLNVLFT
jgi:hypothetical protein